MRVMSQERVSNLGISLTPIMVFGTLLIIFCMAVLVIFRLKCMEEGYKISNLTIELDNKTLEYEAVSQRYSDTLRWERLYSKAKDMDFIFPVGGRVYYVQK